MKSHRHLRGALLSLVTILALLSATNGAYAAAGVVVSASCRAAIWDGGGSSSPDPVQGDYCPDFVSYPVTSEIVRGAFVGWLAPTDIYLIEAKANYAARGDYGNLGVLAGSMAANPYSNPRWYSNLGQSSVTVTATDTILVTSPLLAQGTYVTINLAGYVEGFVSGSLYKNSDPNSANTYAFVSSSLTILEQYNNAIGGVFGFNSCIGYNPGPCGEGTSGSFFQSYSDTMLVQVGSTLSLSTYMQASSDSYADNRLLGKSLYAKSNAEAMNSFTTYLTPVTDGVQLLAESGHNYSASAVPIPAAVWLFGSGLLGLVGAAQENRVTTRATLRCAAAEGLWHSSAAHVPARHLNDFSRSPDARLRPNLFV